MGINQSAVFISYTFLAAACLFPNLANATSAPTALAFGTAPMTLVKSTCSSAVEFATVNSSGQIADATQNVTVQITVNNSSLKFYSDSKCKSAISSVVVSKGTSGNGFYISSAVAGTFALKISASGLTSPAAQNEVITSGVTPSPSPSPSSIVAPSQAASAGYKSLVFDDEFTSASTISPNGSGTYKWYPDSFAGVDTKSSFYSVQNGYLTINSDNSGYGDALNSATTGETAGAWQHAYFEAAIRFNPAGHTSGAWPAFWSYSMDYFLNGNASSNHDELDFFEAYPTGSSVTYITTIHDWQGSTNAAQNSNNVPTIPANTDFTQFHVYGCLWTPNKVTWYFDNVPVTTVQTGPGTSYTAIESDKMFIILGTGVNWPMDVDYVRVWQ